MTAIVRCAACHSCQQRLRVETTADPSTIRWVCKVHARDDERDRRFAELDARRPLKDENKRADREFVRHTDPTATAVEQEMALAEAEKLLGEVEPADGSS